MEKKKKIGCLLEPHLKVALQNKRKKKKKLPIPLKFNKEHKIF